MKLTVTVKPRAKTPSVERIDGTHVVVRVKEPAHEGRANRAAIKALSAFLRLAPSRLVITQGASSKHKVIDVL